MPCGLFLPISQYFKGEKTSAFSYIKTGCDFLCFIGFFTQGESVHGKKKRQAERAQTTKCKFISLERMALQNNQSQV